MFLLISQSESIKFPTTDCSNIAPPKTSDSMPPSLERVKEIVGSKIAENLR